MTSVPKPLKFLRPHYKPLMETYAKWPAAGDNAHLVFNKKLFADVLSVLAMTFSEDGVRNTLRFRLEGSAEPIGQWGHEYLRCASLFRPSEITPRAERACAFLLAGIWRARSGRSLRSGSRTRRRRTTCTLPSAFAAPALCR